MKCLVLFQNEDNLNFLCKYEGRSFWWNRLIRPFVCELLSTRWSPSAEIETRWDQKHGHKILLQEF